mmetsp:Transcript_10603/g.16189  ORF Transcript_10603/g.16189 Transcript_10603/m.16189 type:complete len:319 (+) Transcript_10603:495-1451(+)
MTLITAIENAAGAIALVQKDPSIPVSFGIPAKRGRASVHLAFLAMLKHSTGKPSNLAKSDAPTIAKSAVGHPERTKGRTTDKAEVTAATARVGRSTFCGSHACCAAFLNTLNWDCNNKQPNPFKNPDMTGLLTKSMSFPPRKTPNAISNMAAVKTVAPIYLVEPSTITLESGTTTTPADPATRPGRIPVKLATVPNTTELQTPIRGSTPAMLAKAIDDGMDASATVVPESISFSTSLWLVSAPAAVSVGRSLSDFCCCCSCLTTTFLTTTAGRRCFLCATTPPRGLKPASVTAKVVKNKSNVLDSFIVLFLIMNGFGQ